MTRYNRQTMLKFGLAFPESPNTTFTVSQTYSTTMNSLNALTDDDVVIARRHLRKVREYACNAMDEVPTCGTVIWTWPSLR